MDKWGRIWLAIAVVACGLMVLMAVSKPVEYMRPATPTPATTTTGTTTPTTCAP